MPAHDRDCNWQQHRGRCDCTPHKSRAERERSGGFGPVVLTKAQQKLCEFGGYGQEDLRLARLIGAQVCERYGMDTAEELDRIRKGEIWNDHIAVQASLAAIRITKAS